MTRSLLFWLALAAGSFAVGFVGKLLWEALR